MKKRAKPRSGLSRLLTAGIIIIGGYVFNNIVIPKLKQRFLQ
jgi:hypothetical protein